MVQRHVYLSRTVYDFHPCIFTNERCIAINPNFNQTKPLKLYLQDPKIVHPIALRMSPDGQPLAMEGTVGVRARAFSGNSI